MKTVRMFYKFVSTKKLCMCFPTIAEGLNFGSYGVRGCRLPLALLLGLVAVAGGHF